MRSRWSLFNSGFIVFSTWYVIAYVVTSGTFNGLLIGFAYGCAAAAGGLLFGVGVGIAAHAVNLNAVHRGVRVGDARDGAHVSLGKLPPIVPVVRKSDDASYHAIAEHGVDSVSESLPPTGSDPPPEHGNSGVADTAVAPLPGPAAEAPGVPVPDRLAVECARFVTERDIVSIAGGEGGGADVATIDRAANPAEFGEFMALVSALENDGVDVSRVSVSVGEGGLPAAVTFPVASNDEGVFQ